MNSNDSIIRSKDLFIPLKLFKNISKLQLQFSESLVNKIPIYNTTNLFFFSGKNVCFDAKHIVSDFCHPLPTSILIDGVKLYTNC